MFVTPSFYKCTNNRENYKSYFFELLNKSINIFKWHNLPSTIDSDILEMFLLINGDVAFFKLNNEIYATTGNKGGIQNQNYIWDRYIITNPYLSKIYGQDKLDLVNGVDCEIIYNQPTDKVNIFSSNFNRILSRTAGIMADNLTSINCQQINSRVQTIVTADDSNISKSAELKLEDMYNGKPFAIMSSDLISSFDINMKSGQNDNIKNLIELNNYMYAQFLHNIGITSNEVNKKERVITDEINDNKIECNFNIDILFNSRKEGIERVNKMFGTDIYITKNELLQEKEVQENETNVQESE